MAPEQRDTNVLLCGDGETLCPQLIVLLNTIRSSFLQHAASH